MKTRYYIKIFVVFCFILSCGHAKAQCTPSFIVIYDPNNNGVVTFSSTSTPPGPSAYYSWNFGNYSVSGTGNSYAAPVVTYTSTGTYTVSLTYSNACVPVTYSQVIVINCALNTAFTTSNMAPGTYSFANYSTGTVATTSYVWNYGDMSATTTATNGLHIYTSNGLYFVQLKASNNGAVFCVDSTVVSVNVTSVVMPCSLTASYTAVSMGSGVFNFINNSTGTTTATDYTLNYGDSTPPVTATNFTSLTHAYAANGTYTTTLTLKNATNCVSSAVQVVQVVAVPPPCSVNASYTHTVLTGGVVNFSNTSQGALSANSYAWDFGDGVYSNLKSPTHVFSYTGAYDVKLKVTDSLFTACSDSIVYSLNITGLPCSANSNFTLDSTNVPQYWNATPLFPWNVSSALWSWGDGSYSDSLYTSHNYATAGTYSICLSVTVSCGATSSSCVYQSLYKTVGQQQDLSIVHVNVKKPSLTNSIAALTGGDGVYSLYPNPNNGTFNLLLTGLQQSRVSLYIYNLIGEAVYATETPVNNGDPIAVTPEAIPNGIYFVSIHTGNQVFTKKIIVNKP